jgi:type III restriction enzyme
MSITEHIARLMSLRDPQTESLERLDAIASKADFKTTAIDEIARISKEQLPDSPDIQFDTEFASYCFALATGVGKTRLMGAMIYYLWKTKGYRNFFILAPGTTIYNKLRADLQPANEKYMFTGLSDFPRPEVYDGDNYLQYNEPTLEFREMGQPFIFIFNISKIFTRGDVEFKFHRYHELLGASFSSILQGMGDLVVLMDESHRYRAPASLKAINNLKPVLGLEFTATPKYEKNVAYSFSLGQAVGRYIKTPTVVTRTNLTTADRDSVERVTLADGTTLDIPTIEKIKLNDGLLMHEKKKARLIEYCDAIGVPTVRPFVLISTKDTDHAKDIRAFVESEEFFEGRYNGKVIEVHSKQTGAESEENIERLLSVEDPHSSVEIVIHVNMLKEGWDVKNLYTIIPLRASVSEILTEQTIGRGLRLPFGELTAEPDLDELEIVSHDKYEDIIAEARKTGLFRVKQIEDKDLTPVTTVQVAMPLSGDTMTALETISRMKEPVSPQELLSDEARLNRLVDELIERQAELTKQRAEQGAVTPTPTDEGMGQGVLFPSLEDIAEPVDVETLRKEYREKLRAEIKVFAEKNITIPKIITYTEPKTAFKPFVAKPSMPDLALVEQHIRSANLATGEQRTGDAVETWAVEDPRSFLAGKLLDEVDEFDATDKEFILKLVDDYIAALNKTPEELKHLVHLYRSTIVADLRKQVLANIYDETEVEYKVRQDFIVFKSFPKTIKEKDGILDLREPIIVRSEVTKYLFQNITKSLFDKVAFDSVPEKDFAIVLEDDPKVLKWIRPPLNQMPIFYKGGNYNPDFIVETADRKYLVEVKARGEIDDPRLAVKEKAKSAIKWCEIATQIEGAKPWEYKLVPDDVIKTTNDLAFIASQAVRL